MNLKEFTLIYPVIESAEVLTALQSVIPAEAIDQAIAHTNTQAQRTRSLPTSPARLSGDWHEPVG